MVLTVRFAYRAWVEDYGANLTASVAAQFRELRRERGWSLAYLASLADLHPSTIHLIEDGKRGITLATAARIARAFDVPLADLIAEADRD